MAPGCPCSPSLTWCPGNTQLRAGSIISQLAKSWDLCFGAHGAFAGLEAEAANWIWWCFPQGPAQEEGGKQVRCHREVAEELKGQQEAKLVVSLELWQRGEV